MKDDEDFEEDVPDDPLYAVIEGPKMTDDEISKLKLEIC